MVAAREMLNLDVIESRVNNNLTHKPRVKPLNKNRNILTKSSFDNEL